MKKIITTFLIFNSTFLISQTKHSDIKATLEVDPVFNKVTVKLKTDSYSLNNCKVQIIDSKKNIVKTVDLPKATKQIESNIDILDLESGNYTCIIYQEKVELYKSEFFKDAIFMEPQTLPVIKKSENK